MAGRAAIIGGGVIGGGWAARFLLMGWDVALYDPSPDALARVDRVLEQARYALPMLYDTALPEEGRLSRAATLEEAVAGADYIQESVPERLDLKRQVYRAIEVVNETAPIGSSTSGFRPSELRKGLRTGERLVVAHPFNPVYLLPLVEVVGEGDVVARATGILNGIGMFPLPVKKEIDAHIADRLLEAVWREALWLVKDGVATTGDIDEAIRMGFGLRWAQMGLFETYRIAGGDGGMAHFLSQFGPALKWPWTKLMDVPDLTPDLIRTIAAQSDAQSGHTPIPDLEARRDANLVAILRALRARGEAAGQQIARHEATIARPDPDALTSVRRTVPVDWTDYNAHMNEGRYGQVFSDAADAVMAAFGADGDYVASGLSYFTVSTDVRYLNETHAGERIYVRSRIRLAEGKKLKLWHEMRRERDDACLATCEQFLLHVDLTTRKSCPPRSDIEARLMALAARHAAESD